MAYSRPEPLRGKHDFGDFSCDEESLDNWLHRYSRHAEAGGSARVFVTTDGGTVVGYYALTVGGVEPSAATARLLKGQPAKKPIPVAILARLTVDKHHQGRGLGRSLLQDALLRTVAAAESVGIRALVVHAYPEAQSFYARFGFEPSPTDKLHMVLLMKDLARFLAEAEKA
ncbi:MAG TPA: GNAT family N-acetyltransferase [Solirubrobacterales bacterium]|nr:GNAT family N-acetyltransferase [Solirubrobacterales bacterium]